jgi:hemerythrin-like metal-binding protein
MEFTLYKGLRFNMILLSCDSKYSVGTDKIDNQHRHLIELLNTLHDAMLQGKGKEKMKTILNELVEYTKYHLKTEEEL